MIAWLAALALAAEPAITPPVPTAELEVAWPGEPTDDSAHRVELELTISADGAITAIRPVAGEPTFQDALIGALSELSFVPATEDGEPIEVVVPFSWTFQQAAVSLAGSLRIAGTNLPASGFALAVDEQLLTTDAEGQFALRGLEAGEHTVQLREPSFRMAPVTLELATDERVDLELWAVEERWGSEVVGTYAGRRDATLRRSMNAEQIREAPGSLGDPVRALQNLPGLARTPLDAGWLMLRGGFPEDTPVFLDGVRVPALYHLGGLTSILHPEAVERIDLYPGAAPARLSRGLSGAAELTSRRLTGDTHVVGGVNLAFAHLAAEVPLGEESGFALTGRRSYLDAVLRAALGAERAQIAPRFWDASARVDTPHAGLMVTGMWDEASFPSEDAGDLDAAGQRAIIAQGRVEGDLGSVHILARPWLSLNHTDLSGFRDERVRELSPGGRLELSGEVEQSQWLLGVEGSHRLWRIERDGESRSNTASYVDPYAELLTGTGPLRARLGARLDTLFVPGHLPRVGLSPRADGRLALTEHTDLTAAAWQTHQEPPRTFLLGYPDGPYLPLERNTGTSVGLRTAHPRWGLEGELWGRRLQDVVGFEGDGTLQGFRMRAAGIETRAWARSGRLNGELIYQYTASQAAGEPGDAYRSIRFEQPHRLVALLSARLPRDWAVGARFRYSSGVPIPTNTITAYDILRQQEITTEATPGGRLPPYHALDVRISRPFTFKHWKLNAFLDVQNVYNRRIPEPAINGIDETLLVYSYGLPTLPLFGVDAEFWPRRKRDSGE